VPWTVHRHLRIAAAVGWNIVSVAASCLGAMFCREERAIDLFDKCRCMVYLVMAPLTPCAATAAGITLFAFWLRSWCAFERLQSSPPP
jgi:hypothetical protein